MDKGSNTARERYGYQGLKSLGIKIRVTSPGKFPRLSEVVAESKKN